MRLTPIALLPKSTSQAYDDSGNLVIKGAGLPPSRIPYHPAHRPREFSWPSTFGRVPPLGYFCIRSYFEKLVTREMGAFLDDAFNISLPYREPQNVEESDILQLLLPGMHRQSRAMMWKNVDPRLWVTLIRIYWPEDLPGTFLAYNLPLSDPYLPYIQYLEPTERFTLITILDLRKSPNLRDDTILFLRSLHQLSVLDCSYTDLTSSPFKKLADTLQFDANETARFRGLWRLRTLGLRGCKRIDVTVATHLARFPLLSVVDLRDTACKNPPHLVGWQDMLPSDMYFDLYHPAPPSQFIKQLLVISDLYKRQLFPSKHPPFVIDINAAFHPPATKEQMEANAALFPEQDGYMIIGRDASYTLGTLPSAERRRESIHAPPMTWNEDWDDLPLQHKTLPHKLYFKEKPVELASDREAATWAALEAARMEAYYQHQVTQQNQEVQATKRQERATIERSRDFEALSAQEKLNRKLIFVRIPPSYGSPDDLLRNSGRERSGQSRLESIRSAQRSQLSISNDIAQISGSKGKRAQPQASMWIDILDGATPMASSEHGQRPLVARRSIKNPWGKVTTEVDQARKRVRME